MQAALRAEVQAALLPSPGSGSGGGGGGGGDGDDQSIASTLEGLPLLNGVINETLRLYPTVPVTMRQAIRDTRLGDHQAIPEGTTLILSMWLMNRSPDVWGEGAAEFRPERWIDDVDAHGTARRPNQTGGASNNYQFLTFLHGPRSCIGQAFAKAEMRCLLAALIGTFSWDLGMEEEKIIPRGVITIKPAQGLYLKMKPLDSVSSS
jgi:cytochrome P450